MSTPISNGVQFPEPNLDEVKDHFKQFKGGRVTLTKDENSGIAYIYLDHPEKKNCFSGKMMVEMNNIITELENWKTGKGLIIHSGTNVFCSGVFLDMTRNFLNDPNQAYWMSFLMEDSARRLRNLPLVSVAVVQGKAIAGGSELMLWADFRLLAKDAGVIYAHAKMGLTCAWGGGLLLKTIVGPARALEFTLTCRKIGAEEALAVGLADGIVNVETRLEEAKEWLGTRIGFSAEVVRGQKLGLIEQRTCELPKNFASLWGKQSHVNAFGSSVKH
jgi:ethylmalonyl-CoA/methylmalonyl-CoA decarboxylase